VCQNAVEQVVEVQEAAVSRVQDAFLSVQLELYKIEAARKAVEILRSEAEETLATLHSERQKIDLVSAELQMFAPKVRALNEQHRKPALVQLPALQLMATKAYTSCPLNSSLEDNSSRAAMQTIDAELQGVEVIPCGGDGLLHADVASS
jgi:hypothetical protein